MAGPMGETTEQDLQTRFTYHPPDSEQVSAFERIRREAHEIAHIILEEVPAGRERSLAWTKLEEAVMWANAGVARHGRMHRTTSTPPGAPRRRR